MASTADLVAESLPDLPRKQFEEEQKPKTFKTMTMREGWTYIRNVITVEPIIGAYILAPILCAPALLNLEFEKGCRVNLNYSDVVCEAILGSEALNYTVETDNIQKIISNMHSWQLPVQSIMPLILVFFLGSYSDRHKLRKPFLLIPIFGEFFAVAGCILCVIFMRQWSLEVQGVLQTVVPSFFGGQTMIVMAVFAYIADVSSVEMRTLRVGVVQIVLNVCYPLAQSVSGILFEEIGYIGVLSIAAVLYLFAMIYGIFCLKEPKKPDVTTSKVPFLVDAFDPRQAIDTFGILLKKKPGNNRLFIAAILFTLFIYSVVATGEASIFFSYAKGVFSWTPVEYSYFITVNTLVHLVGTILGLPLFTNILKLSDPMILFLTFVDKIVTNIIFGIAKTATMLYVATVVSLITGLSAVPIRSMATKAVAEDDLGKAQSLFGIFEALGPAVAAPVYNTLIYVNTLETFPSAYFYFGAILYALTIIVIFWMYFTLKKKTNRVQEQPSETNGKPVEEYQITHI